MPRNALPEKEGSTTRREKGLERDGQALAEYVLIVTLIALVCIGAVSLLGIPIQSFYTGFNGSF
ncbi:MAG: hypothetical protein HZA60_03210 [Deltaproteobacteria bacterium]|nr:hypothetical protein [Deltaproteobacteria bacterium]